MRVLVTNDDGIDAPGLRQLARAAVDGGHDVVVAAPDSEASGVSAALTAVAEDGRLEVERHELKDLGGVPAFGVGASPAYIVVLAGLGAFGDPPDLVLSGINRGANAGRAVRVRLRHPDPGRGGGDGGTRPTGLRTPGESP